MNNGVNVLIVEDEFIIAENIRDALERVGYRVSGHAYSFEEALELLEEEVPDIALLDINLDGEKDGVELGKHLREHFDLPFIFLTSFSDKKTIDRAKAAQPDGYLLKPFEGGDLFAAIEIALYNFSGKSRPAVPKGGDQKSPDILIRDAVFIKKKDLFVKVLIKDILWIKSDHIYLELSTRSGDNFTIRSSFKTFLDQIGENFFRIHKSYAVNLKAIEALNQSVVIINGEEIPIGRSYREELMEQMQTLL